MGVSDKLFEFGETSAQNRQALLNHTQHITEMKKKLDDVVSKRKFNSLEEKTKGFALNKELKELYERVVPPVAAMEEVGREMKAQVDRVEAICWEFDKTLMNKASKVDVMGVEQKLRDYLKRDEF